MVEREKQHPSRTPTDPLHPRRHRGIFPTKAQPGSRPRSNNNRRRQRQERRRRTTQQTQQHPTERTPRPREPTVKIHHRSRPHRIRMQVRGWQDKAHIDRADHLLTLPDNALLKTMDHSTLPLLIPQHLFPQNRPPHQKCGWWYVPTQETDYRA